MAADTDYPQQSPSHQSAHAGAYRNVGGRERQLSVLAGAGALVYAVQRGGVLGWVVGALGGMLAYRGMTGYCSVYAKTGMNTARAMPNAREMHFSTGMTIERRPEELYGYWRDFTRLPSFMKFISEVRAVSENRTRWVAEGSRGPSLEWESEVVEDVPNERIAWRSVEGSEIHNRGEIRFRPAPGDRGTEVQLELHYEPPMGKPGHLLADLFNGISEEAAREDLRRFKRLMEGGEIPTATYARVAGTAPGDAAKPAAIAPPAQGATTSVATSTTH